jgi:hypothetical protein
MGPKVNVSADGSSLVMANAGRSNGETSVNLVQKNSGCSREGRRQAARSGATEVADQHQSLHKSALESRFWRGSESALGRLEKLSKNPISSIACW